MSLFDQRIQTPQDFALGVYLSSGFPLKVIALCLGISKATVEKHTAKLYVRYGVNCRALFTAKWITQEFP